MKVIFLGTLPPIIGLSPYCLHISAALSKKIDLEFLNFHQFSLSSTKFDRETKIDETYYTDSLKKLNVQNILNWYSPFSSFKAGIKLHGDVLHIQWWISSLLFVYFPILIMAKLKDIKVVVSVHNVLPHERRRIDLLLDKIAKKIVFPFADAVIIHNLRNKEKLLQLYKLNEKKVFIISHGVLHLVKKKTVSQYEAKEYLHLPHKKRVVLFFGYIREYKGLDVLINAFASLRKEIDDVILLIVGQTWKDKWDKYEELIRKNKLDNDVRVELGFVPESKIRYYFSAADIVVLPYKYLDTHGGGGALALAFKKPLLVTDVGGLPEYIKDKQALVKPYDVKDLAKSLKQVLQDKSLHNKLSKDAEDLSKELTWDKIADQTIEVYRNLL